MEVWADLKCSVHTFFTGGRNRSGSERSSVTMSTLPSMPDTKNSSLPKAVRSLKDWGWILKEEYISLCREITKKV